MRLFQSRRLLFLFILLSFLSLYAYTPDTIKRVDQGNQIDREIGISITPTFTMDTVNPSITVTSPNGGELWLMNSQKNISWFAYDSNFVTNPINIMLSIDNGLNYSPIIDNLENSGTYPWIIPDLFGPQSLIKIWATDTFGNVGFDLSDVVFNLPGTTVSVSPLFYMDTINPVVNLFSPNGGESWYVGETNSITWSASDSNFPSLPVNLEYKVDTAWITLETSYGNDGTYQWIIPNSLTTHGYVRISVIDLFGNAAADSSENSFTIDDATPATVQNVHISINDTLNVTITWDPVTLTVQGNPIVPSGYIVLCNSSNDPWNMTSFYVLGTTETETVYVHENVLPSVPHMFYSVVAVKNYRTKFSDIVSDIRQRSFKDSPISWNEIKRKLAE